MVATMATKSNTAEAIPAIALGLKDRDRSVIWAGPADLRLHRSYQEGLEGIILIIG